MDKNKKPADLPEDETCMPHECISMDGFQTYSGEHGLAIIDRHTGYVWCEKSGDRTSGTAQNMYDILLLHLNSGIYHVKRIKTDHGSNLLGGIIKEVCEKLGISQDQSSAYHAAGNKLA